MARLWPAYLMRRGTFLVSLVFSTEKALLLIIILYSNALVEQPYRKVGCDTIKF